MRYTINKTEYLDEQGLKELWEKIKIYVADHTIEVDGEAIDLSNYVTVAQLEEALKNIEPDLSDYVTFDDLANELLNYALKEHKHEEYLTEHQNLDNYATKDYVTDAINNAALGGEDSGVDLSIYAKTDDVNAALEGKADVEHEHSEYLTEHQSLENYATKDYVAEALKDIDVDSEDIDLTGYVKTEEMEDALSYKAEVVHKHILADIIDYEDPDLSSYATTDYVIEKIAEASLEGAEVDLSIYATKEYVDEVVGEGCDCSGGVRVDSNVLIANYELEGDLLDVELPAIPLSNTAGYIVETNFTYNVMGITNKEADENGFCIDDYLKRRGSFTPFHEEDGVGFKDYYITGIEFEEEPEVEFVGDIVQFENTDAGSPFGKRINVYGMSYDITQELLMKYYVSCHPTDELTTYTADGVTKTYFSFNSGFKWQGGLFDNAYFVHYSNTSYGEQIMPEYSYIYRIEAPASESGYVTLKGAKGLFFKGDDWDDSTATYSLVASEHASFTGTTNTMAAGDIIWVLTDATLDDIYFADGIDDSVASEDTVLPDGEEVGSGFVFYNNTDEESPWGKKVRVFKKLTSLTSTSSIIDGVFCCSEEDLDIHTNGEDIVKYLYFNDNDEWVFSCFYDEGYLTSYYKIGEKEYIAPVYDYLYKFTAPETESGYVHVEGVDGEWFDGTYWTSGNCFKPLTMTKNPRSDLNYPSGETHIRSGKTMWLLTNTLLNMEDVTVTDSGEPTSTASYSTWGIKKDFVATIAVTDRETAKKVTYTFTLPSKNKHTYTGNDYIRFSREPLYKRYEHRDIKESTKYYGHEIYDAVPTVGYLQAYVEDCLVDIEGGSVEIPEVDLSGYVKTEDMTAALKTKANVEHTHTLEEITDYSEPDLSNCVTKDELDDYATKDYVIDAINSASLEGSEVDLSSYAKKDHTHTLEDITDYVAPDLTNYVTKDELPEIPEIPDLSGYAKTEDIPDVSNYVTKDEIPDTSKFLTEIPEEYVTQSELETALKDVDVDLSGYAKTEDIEAAINELPEDLYEVAKKNGGCVKEYWYNSGSDKLYSYISGGIEIPTTTNIYLASKLSLHDKLSGLEAFNGTWTEDKYNEMIESNRSQYVIFASTHETISNATATDHAYLIGFNVVTSSIKILEYDGTNTITLYKTLYKEDKAQHLSFNLPATKWYPVFATLKVYESGSYVTSEDVLEAFDLQTEGESFIATGDITIQVGQSTTDSIKGTFTYSGTGWYVQYVILDSDIRTELINTMSLDNGSVNMIPVYYTREEWALEIEKKGEGNSVDLSNYVTKDELDEALDGLSIDGGGESVDLSNYVTKEELEEATDLSNYYTKDETYNKEEIDALVSTSGGSGSSSGGSSSSGGGEVYSTEEVAIGTWIDGSTIYRRVYEKTDLTFGSYGSFTTAPENLDYIISMKILLKNSKGSSLSFDGAFIDSYITSTSSASTLVTNIKAKIIYTYLTGGAFRYYIGTGHESTYGSSMEGKAYLMVDYVKQ